ncbi:hypothetical protein JHK82_027276 [Glycine max]|uniref:Uncharacterized protein n=2 Tax=Glycine subgen. Soja TaxID=1462606 RepID=A0A0R0HQQ6_SOYBN|nr:hypothetical protein JHK87_027169 [Glycine soja]KAG4996471.1 hypothetical protein JHK85_027910 [Glycine max]KAG5003263.1 hypothetical protein JHK86_027402 [Glycine max]KAG5126441.1 hypothetical protein JHK82_027276 [Glycine max]KAG5151043.1 hypothetical protein JHK84_027515 [Glycine max]
MANWAWTGVMVWAWVEKGGCLIGAEAMVKLSNQSTRSRLSYLMEYAMLWFWRMPSTLKVAVNSDLVECVVMMLNLDTMTDVTVKEEVVVEKITHRTRKRIRKKKALHAAAMVG